MYKIILVISWIYCIYMVTKNWLGYIIEIMKGEKEHKYDFAFFELICLISLSLVI